MSRVPFDYTLIDRRHKAFVEGKRDVLLTFVHLILTPRGIFGLMYVTFGLIAFLWGAGLIALDFSRRNDWVFTDATIVTISPVQSGDRFNWQYLYTFVTDTGQKVSGTFVEDTAAFYAVGETALVRYWRTDPTENSVPRGGIPKASVYWLALGFGLVLLGIIAKPLYRHFYAYRELRMLSSQGSPVQGELISANLSGHEMMVRYTFVAPNGSRWEGREPIPAVFVDGFPKSGTVVAVWCAPSGVARLL